VGKEEVLHRGNEAEIELPEIDSRLAQLRGFETDLQNDEVAKAITALHKVFDPQLEWFTSHGVVITYHGSLQYNDPRNLDADVEFMGDNLEFKDIKDRISKAEDELQEPGVWPRKNCDTNFGHCSIGKIRKELKEFEGEEHYNPNPEEDYDFNPELDASLILSSKVLFESQRPQLEGLQKKVRRLIAENQWLKEGVLYELTDVVNIRQERRRT